LQSFETPHALTANQPAEWKVPLRDHDHVFLKGHRIMVQIQSTWFPLIDRNPQKFVPSIYKAAASDFIPATQRVYCSMPMLSHYASKTCAGYGLSNVQYQRSIGIEQ